ncbi:MAG TPA: sulfotransferase [Candidatus Sulfopaludibacter sp.]|nr:sulfotransferase [Candidatus Sulfopaludibacter sp.]
MLKEKPLVKNGERPGSDPVFVVGVLRSGTSLLYALLNLHPQVALMYECDVWNFPEVFCGIRFRRDWLRRQEFYNQALSRHRLIFGDSLRGLEKIQAPEDLYRVFSEGKDKPLFGEKSPFYCAHLLRLARRYPGCRFILLWRDPVDIYRSVIRAGRKERFFRRRGILNRLIFYREQMIRQAVRLERVGVPLCHVTYADLTGDTEETCRRICRFLGIEFDAKMLDLASADLSAVFPGPEHNHLRSGRIERRQLADETEAEDMDPMIRKRLQRFDARWCRLQSQWLGSQTDAAAGPEPSVAERLYYKVTGVFFQAIDNGKRALFEFLPLAWLRTYRQTKKWLLARRAELPADRRSLGEQFRSHWITILVSAVVMAIVACADILTGPDVTLLPFYLIPCAALTLVVNYRWGTFAVATVMVIWSAIQAQQNPNLNLGHWKTLVWDAGMRFVVFQIIVLLLNRVRIEATQDGETA